MYISMLRDGREANKMYNSMLRKSAVEAFNGYSKEKEEKFKHVLDSFVKRVKGILFDEYLLKEYQVEIISINKEFLNIKMKIEDDLIIIAKDHGKGKIKLFLEKKCKKCGEIYEVNFDSLASLGYCILREEKEDFHFCKIEKNSLSDRLLSIFREIVMESK